MTVPGGTGGPPEPGAAGRPPGAGEGLAGTGERPPDAGGRRAGRVLASVVALCAAGAGLALYASTRTWTVELTARPAPLPPLRDVRTGADLAPWLPALAVVGLAGAGAVLATRSALRRLVGVVLVLVGLAEVAGGVTGLSAPGRGGPGWPLLCLLGGVLVVAGGLVTVVRGPGWPTMGARYDRRPADGVTGSGRDDERPVDAGTSPEPGPVTGRRTIQAWDALDRGEDPTDT